MTKDLIKYCVTLLLAVCAMASSCEDTSCYIREVCDVRGPIKIHIVNQEYPRCLPALTISPPVHSIVLHNQQGKVFGRLECLGNDNCLSDTRFRDLAICGEGGEIPSDAPIFETDGENEEDYFEARGCITSRKWLTEYNTFECNDYFEIVATDVENNQGVVTYNQHFSYDTHDWLGSNTDSEEY